MFHGCSSLKSLDLSGFKAPKVKDMRCMFYDCPSLESLDLSGLDTSRLENMYGMFWGCSSLKSLDLSGFKTSKAKYVSDMFSGCSSLKSISVGPGWSTAAVKKGGSMFRGCTKLVGGNGTVYNAKHVSVKRARVDKKGKPGYLTYVGPVITIADWSKAYTGNAVKYAGKVKVTGSKGKITFQYYSDKKCSKQVKAKDVKAVGTYYVRAKLAVDGGSVASNVAKLTIKAK